MAINEEAGSGGSVIGSHIATKPLRQNDIPLTYAPIAGM